MSPCEVVLPVWIRPFKKAWGQIIPKSAILFKNLLVRNCGAERTGIEKGASGASVDVEFCSAWRLAMPSMLGKGGSGGVSFFGLGDLGPMGWLL